MSKNPEYHQRRSNGSALSRRHAAAKRPFRFEELYCRAFELPGALLGALPSKGLTQEKSTVLTYLFLLLCAVMAVAIFVLANRNARLRKFHEFEATAVHTLQLESCSGIKASNLYAYLCALATALGTQALLRNLKLRPGEFNRVVSDAIDTAYLLKKDEPDKKVARGALMLFALCLDDTMSRSQSAGVKEGDEGKLVGTIGAVTLLASVGWYPDSNADLVTCGLSEASPANEMAEYWRTTEQAHRDQVESAFEHVVRTALDSSTAAYVRHKVFSELNESAPSSN